MIIDTSTLINKYLTKSPNDFGEKIVNYLSLVLRYKIFGSPLFSMNILLILYLEHSSLNERINFRYRI